MGPKVKIRIEILSGDIISKSLQFEKEIIKIGRNPDSDIVIKDKKASRKHAYIVQTDKGLMLEDLGSKNGTFVNGEKIKKSVALSPEDIIKIGKNTFTLQQIEKEKSFSQKNKLAIYMAIAIFIVVLAVVIPTIYLIGTEKYKVVDRTNQGELLYSYSIPESFNSYFDNENLVEYFFNGSKSKLGWIIIYNFFNEKITESDLLFDANSLDSEPEYYEEFNEAYVSLDEKKSSEFIESKGDRKAFLVEYEGNTSFNNIANVNFWDSKETLMYFTFISIEGNYNYLAFISFFDTGFEAPKDKELLSNMVDSLNIINFN